MKTSGCWSTTSTSQPEKNNMMYKNPKAKKKKKKKRFAQSGSPKPGCSLITETRVLAAIPTAPSCLSIESPRDQLMKGQCGMISLESAGGQQQGRQGRFGTWTLLLPGPVPVLVGYLGFLSRRMKAGRRKAGTQGTALDSWHLATRERDNR